MKRQKNKTHNTKVDSLAQAAAVLGCGLQAVKQAKREGCPAFHSTRVDLALLRPWLEERKKRMEDPMGRVALENRKLLAQVARMEFSNDAEKGLYILVTEAERETTMMSNDAKNILRSKFEGELPPMLEGLSAAEIQVRCKAAVDEVCERLSK